MLDDGYTPGDIIKKWDKDLQEYIKITKRYLLYN
jgi:hypothetical protein